MALQGRKKAFYAPVTRVCYHTVSAGSHEPYLRAILARACRPVLRGGLGYGSVVVTHRGCAGVPITSPRLYTAGHTEDLKQALMYLLYHYPQSRLLGLGFSLGANVMTRYVSEEGDKSRLPSAVVLSCPWDMQKNGHALVSTFAGKNLYARGMGRNMVRLVRRHERSLRKFPDHPICKELPSVLALRFPTLPHFDDTFTRRVGGEAPTFPIPTIDDYYFWASSDKRIQDIGIPFLSINSDDDPVVTSVPLDSKGNGSIVMVLTKKVGYLGWFTSGSERWTTQPILEWLELMGNGVVLDNSPHLPLSVDCDGFIRGKEEQLACTVEAVNDGVIDGTEGDQSLLRLS
ncbi:Alpha/Beta hydrolase protein [Gymnopilus junonius]|uniref:Alpha/Beta hydrolase protein n=1 Tax=Gymnopilus junonius TaxID=109634 RepID=A0A9P5TU44_GYMJU|nr:Alpha/Beta hydrolase protein [Gymnopilus junonius]